jgi:hypothetical protein
MMYSEPQTGAMRQNQAFVRFAEQTVREDARPGFPVLSGESFYIQEVSVS